MKLRSRDNHDNKITVMATGKVCYEKSVDLKSVQGSVLKNVIRARKSTGVIELNRLTGSAQMLWESGMAK